MPRKNIRTLTDEEVEQGWHVGAHWKGTPLYFCNECSYDDVNLTRMRGHSVEVHQMALIAAQSSAQAAKIKALDVLLYDANAKVITEREVSE